MIAERTLTIRLPETLLSSALRAARIEDVSAGEFVRAALADRVAELDPSAQSDSVGIIRRALRRDFAVAADWVDLQRRLRTRGLVLRLREGEVVLMTWPIERRLVPLARLGVSSEELTVLYRAPFPAFGPARAKAASRAA